MRRKERSIDDLAAREGIIRDSVYLSLAMVDDGKPYVLPLNFGYDDGKIYIHCAKDGRKMDILRNSGGKLPVSGVFVGKCAFHDPGKGACGLTARYASVMFEGVAEEITNDIERLRGMKIILRHFGKEDLPLTVADMAGTGMIGIDVSEWSAKSNIPRTE